MIRDPNSTANIARSVLAKKKNSFLLRYLLQYQSDIESNKRAKVLLTKLILTTKDYTNLLSIYSKV